MRIFSALAVLCAFIAFPVFADTPAIEEPNGDFVPPEHPVTAQHGGIAYATGGVGDEEILAMHSMEPTYSLHVLTTVQDGAFVGDYTLSIYDDKGNRLFEQPGQGPLFLVKLAPGNYMLEEEVKGQPAQQKKVRIPVSGHRDIEFRWPGSALHNND